MKKYEELEKKEARSQEIASKSKLIEKDAFEISEEIKKKWWNKNKNRIMEIVNEDNSLF